MIFASTSAAVSWVKWIARVSLHWRDIENLETPSRAANIISTEKSTIPLYGANMQACAKSDLFKPSFFIYLSHCAMRRTPSDPGK